MQNGVRVRNGGLKSGKELWLGSESAALQSPGFRTLPYWHIQTRNSHTFNLTRNLFQFLPAAILFSHSKFFNVYKIQKKTIFKHPGEHGLSSQGT